MSNSGRVEQGLSFHMKEVGFILHLVPSFWRKSATEGIGWVPGDAWSYLP